MDRALYTCFIVTIIIIIIIMIIIKNVQKEGFKFIS